MQAEAIQARQIRLGLGIDHVWYFAVLAAFGLLVSIVPIVPHDFWWHLRIGEIITTTHSIPATNLFSWTIPVDKPFIYGEWLSEVLLYAVFSLGGLNLLIFVRTILALVLFGWIGLESKRRSGSWRIGGVALALACIMASNNVNIRPQIWAWLPFFSFLVILRVYSEGSKRPAWLLLLPLIMIYWVNVHGTYILGLALIGIYFVGETLRTYLKFDNALSWGKIGGLVGAGVLSGLAALVNPWNINAFRYVVNMAKDPSSQKLVSEWQPTVPDNYASIIFFVSILLFLAIFAFSKFRPTPTDFLLIVAFVWLAWSGLRSVFWYAIVTAPIFAERVGIILQGKPWLAIPPRTILNLILVILFFIPLLAVQPWFVQYIPFPNGYWKITLKDSLAGPLLATSTPVNATEYLKAHPGGKLFNDMGYGSYLIWADPDQHVFVDPRVELYPYDEWLDYLRISGGVRYDQLLDQYGANRILLDVNDQKELILQLESDPKWAREYQDEHSQVWIKR